MLVYNTNYHALVVYIINYQSMVVYNINYHALVALVVWFVLSTIYGLLKIFSCIQIYK